MSEATAAPERKLPGALAGVRVVDLSRVLAGPLCTQMLSDHGANVIKVEPPSGDETRLLGPPFTPSGDAAYFSSINRGKRAVSIDLSSTDGRAALERLLEDADVLVENFLPGTTQRWGLDYDTLSRRYPRLIYCSISGFGADGPLGGLPGYDAVLQAMCGLMSINGTAESGPMRMGIPVVDHLTGYTALTGILMALYVRARTGKGQKVEATLFDAALSLLVPHAANWFYSNRTPGLLGNAHPNISPYDKFKARDGELFLGVVNDGQFRRLCEHIGRADLLDDPRFTTNAQRVENVAALRQELERALASLPVEALCRELMARGVPAGPVYSVPQALSQPHAAHRGMKVNDGDYRGIGLPVKLSVTPGQPGCPPPRFEHAHTVAEAQIGDNK